MGWRAMLGAVLAAAVAGNAQAQPAAEPWPTRPLVFVVTASPGGSSDIMTRILADRLREPLGQPVLVENRAGAGGTIGADYVAKSPPDSNRFVLASVHLALFIATQKQLPFDPLADLTPVTDFARVPNMLIVHSAVPARSVAELVAHARARPGEMSYATGTQGTLQHLLGTLFARQAGLSMTPVHYRGSAPAINDLLAGRVPMMFETLPSAARLVRGGDVRGLAVTSATRSPVFADLPTMAESGFPDATATTWYGLLGPKGLPPAAAERLRDAVVVALRSPQVTEAWAQDGASGGGMSVPEFRSFWGDEINRWRRAVSEAGLTLD
ncbi:Bug family tripartite tricarboxylate transporter substrate binding protein [Roseomonas sp. BN140053]|uniref:Bug family tripartite tricarboxylate transporter substrate binding protein n=1 Tax=Roseomonas sp. BN140053 TaxID=3391898 RepID=UPI0039E93C66